MPCFEQADNAKRLESKSTILIRCLVKELRAEAEMSARPQSGKYKSAQQRFGRDTQVQASHHKAAIALRFADIMVSLTWIEKTILSCT